MTRREVVVDHVEKVLERVTGNEKLNASGDGEWPFRYDRTTVTVRVLQGDDPWVFIFAPAALEVAEKPELFAKLNDVNQKLRFARCYWNDGTVYVEMELFGGTLDAEEVRAVMSSVGSTCDSVGPEIVAAFGGHTLHEAPEPHEEPPPPNPDEPPGPYL